MRRSQNSWSGEGGGRCRIETRLWKDPFTSSGFTSLLVKSFTQSMKQFSVSLLYVPRNSLNCSNTQGRIILHYSLQGVEPGGRVGGALTCLIWSDSVA